MNALRYYRCTGADGYRFSGKAVCHNGPLRGDQLEQAVWDQVGALLEEPHRVAGEYRRRITQARDGAAMPEEIARLDRQITSLRRGIGRLIDSYTEGVIDKTEFEPRIVGLRLERRGFLSRWRRPRFPSPLSSRVEDWRAGLGRCSCSLLSRPFVCECHSISTMPRFQSPPRRTQRADFPLYALLFASPQGLWDLSCRGDFRL